MRLKLSNGRGNAPLMLFWEWDLLQTEVVHWTGMQYEAIATYQVRENLPVGGDLSLEERRAERAACIDVDEVHLAVSCDGERAHLMNGRLLRSKRQYRNRLIAKLDAKIARCKKGSQHRKKTDAREKETTHKAHPSNSRYRAQDEQRVDLNVASRRRTESDHW